MGALLFLEVLIEIINAWKIYFLTINAQRKWITHSRKMRFCPWNAARQPTPLPDVKLLICFMGHKWLHDKVIKLSRGSIHCDIFLHTFSHPRLHLLPGSIHLDQAQFPTTLQQLVWLDYQFLEEKKQKDTLSGNGWWDKNSKYRGSWVWKEKPY